MARRDRGRQQQWARWVIEAVTDWGHEGGANHDVRRDVVIIAGLGEVPLDDPDGKVGRWDEEHQRNQLRSRAHRLLERHFRPSAEWVTGDHEQDRAVAQALIGVRKYPDSARPHAVLARWTRHLGLPGWEARMRWAAARSVEQGAANGFPSAVAEGALLWLELGDEERAAAAADLLVRNFDPSGPDIDITKVHGSRLTDHLLAVYWRDGRARLADVAADVPSFGGNTLIEAVARAASAAEEGRLDDLRAQVDRLGRMLTIADRECGLYAVVENDRMRRAVATARAWLAELEPPASRPDAGDGVAPTFGATPPALEVVVVATAPAAGVRSLSWRGDVVVAATAEGELAVGLDGQRTLPPPGPPSPTPDRVIVDGDDVRVERADGRTIALRVDWDEDRLEMADQYQVTWSVEGDRFVVWGEYGPFDVLLADGSHVAEVHEHWDGPNYGTQLVGDRLMTWAGDHRIVVFELGLQVSAGVVTGNGWLEDAALGLGGRLVARFDNVDGWTFHDVDRDVAIGPARTPRFVASRPHDGLVALADGDGVWIERYG